MTRTKVIYHVGVLNRNIGDWAGIQSAKYMR